MYQRARTSADASHCETRGTLQEDIKFACVTRPCIHPSYDTADFRLLALDGKEHTGKTLRPRPQLYSLHLAASPRPNTLDERICEATIGEVSPVVICFIIVNKLQATATNRHRGIIALPEISESKEAYIYVSMAASFDLYLGCGQSLTASILPSS